MIKKLFLKKKLIKGFSMVAAIFILVILSLVGTYALNISTRGSVSSEMSIDGVRAYFACKAGLEWLIYQVVQNPAACPASPQTFSLTQQGLKNFSVTCACTATSYTESGATFNLFTLTATSSRGIATDYDYITRQLVVTAMISNNP